MGPGSPGGAFLAGFAFGVAYRALDHLRHRLSEVGRAWDEKEALGRATLSPEEREADDATRRPAVRWILLHG